MSNVSYRVCLLAAAIIWGSSFVVMKNTVDVFQLNTLLGIRFSVAFALLSIVFFKRVAHTDKEHVIKGLLLGVFIYAGYSFQTWGLIYTSPGKNAFLTAIYCIIVPFLNWQIDGAKPDKYNLFSALLCVAGIGLVAVDEALTIGAGDALTIVGGLGFAMHVSAVAKFSKGKDSIVLTVFQFAGAAICSWIFALAIESFPNAGVISPSTIGGLLFLCIFPTAIALLLQNIGQKHVSPSAASIILSLEAVFGVLFSVILYGEELSAQLIIGFIFIFVAIIISETRLSFIKRRIVTGEQN